MTIALGSSVELKLYWTGSYRWYDWKISGVTISERNCPSSEMIAHINTQLPPNNEQQLSFLIPSKSLSENHIFFPLIDNENQQGLASAIRCSVAAANALCLTVNIFYSEPQLSPAHKPYTKSEIIPPKVTFPYFRAGEKYDIILSHDENKIKVYFEKIQSSHLNVEWLFNKLASLWDAMVKVQFLMQTIKFTDDQIEELCTDITETYSCNEIKILISQIESSSFSLPRNSEVHTVTEHQMILSAIQEVCARLQKTLPFITGLETLKGFLFSKNWRQLFRFLKTPLPIKDTAFEKKCRALLYLTVCHNAKKNHDPHLLAYAFSQTPNDPEKTKYSAMYQNWLDGFNILLPSSLTVSPIRLTKKLIFNKIAYALSDCFYNKPSQLDAKTSQKYNQLQEEKIINDMLIFILSFPHAQIKSMLNEEISAIGSQYQKITDQAIALFEKILVKLQTKYFKHLKLERIL